MADDSLGKVNMVIRKRDGQFSVTEESIPKMPPELQALLQERK